MGYLRKSSEAVQVAKGNDGNYLQHCIEIEAAARLAQTDAQGRLHIAFTHGMKPFEKLDPNESTRSLLYDALEESARETPQSNECLLVKAYRLAGASKERYPNSAALLRTFMGKGKLKGGITEVDCKKYETLADFWSGTNVDVACSSWRGQLYADRVLACPSTLDVPWIFSMDPMTYSEVGCEDDAKLHRFDIGLLSSAIGRYIESGQPGIAAIFVYGVQQNNAKFFWEFMDDLSTQLGVYTCSFWVPHRGGNRNLAGLLFSEFELSLGFAPPKLKPGRGVSNK